MREKLEEAFTILKGIEAKEREKQEKALERLKKRAAEVGHKQLGGWNLGGPGEPFGDAGGEEEIDLHRPG